MFFDERNIGKLLQSLFQLDKDFGNRGQGQHLVYYFHSSRQFELESPTGSDLGYYNRIGEILSSRDLDQLEQEFKRPQSDTRGSYYWSLHEKSIEKIKESAPSSSNFSSGVQVETINAILQISPSIFEIERSFDDVYQRIIKVDETYSIFFRKYNELSMKLNNQIDANETLILSLVNSFK